MVEISLPELFPHQPAQVGKSFMDATRKQSQIELQDSSFARFRAIFSLRQEKNNGEPKFLHVSSKIESTTKLYIKKESVRLKERKDGRDAKGDILGNQSNSESLLDCHARDFCSSAGRVEADVVVTRSFGRSAHIGIHFKRVAPVTKVSRWHLWRVGHAQP